MTQDRLPSMSRKPTARSNAGKSPHNERTAPRLALPDLMVAMIKTAARVSCWRHLLRDGRCPFVRSG